MRLRKAFGWSAVESIGSRVFDLVGLWLVINALPKPEIATFGVATASIFLFNLVFIAPETSLMRFQKEWKREGVLSEYLGAFVSFNGIKLLVHLLGLVLVVLYDGANGVFYAVLFSLTTQLVQLAEIARIYHRMELHQGFVAKFELVSKIVWVMACGSVFYFQTAAWYFGIFSVWALFAAAFWMYALRRETQFSLVSERMAKIVFSAVKGFSLWSHMAGVVTLFLYNANILFLQWFGEVRLVDIALMTVVNKTANLFFVVPMFIQGFVPVMLANSSNQAKGMLAVLLGNGAVSAFQLIAFLVGGTYLGRLFGVENHLLDDYYRLGFWVCIGIFVLNVTRPIGTFLMMKTPPWRVFMFIFFPVAVLAALGFSYASLRFQMIGVAIACCVVYCLLAIALFMNFIVYNTQKNQ